LSEEEVALFQTQLPGALPPDVRELLVYSAGFDIVSVLKSGRRGRTVPVILAGSRNIELSNVLPCPVTLLGDGCGNFWVVDVDLTGAWGAILFVCHDPPVIVVQAADLACFLDQVLNPGEGDSKNTLYYVWNAATSLVWKTDPWLVSVRDAQLVPDAALSQFAEQLPQTFCVADLRSKEIGSGFSWGKAGPNTDIRRAGAELLFGVEQKAPSFLKRIFSRAAT
jgi:hypothetical protein